MNSSLTVAIVLVVAKKDFAGLLRRFDGNLNGRLDDAEWQRVQIAVQMEAKQRYRQATSCADWHRLYKPGEASHSFCLVAARKGRFGICVDRRS